MLPVFQVRFSVVPKDNVSIEANFVNSRKVQKDGFSNRQTSLVYYIQNIKHKLVQQNWSTDLAGLGRNLQILFIIDIVQLFQTKDKWFLLKYQYPITIIQYEHRTIFSSTQNVNDGLSSTKNTVFFPFPLILDASPSLAPPTVGSVPFYWMKQPSVESDRFYCTPTWLTILICRFVGVFIQWKSS